MQVAAHRDAGFRDDPDEFFATALRSAHPGLAQRVAAAERVSRYRTCAGGVPTFNRIPSGDGWALVGDASHTTDPISAHGISNALRDAEMLARSLDQALIHPAGARAALARHRRHRDRLNRPIFDTTRHLARFRWTPDEASALLRIMNGAVHDECDALVRLGPLPAPALV